MSRFRVFTLAAALAWGAAASPAFAQDPSAAGGGAPPADGAHVDVDIEGVTPGLSLDVFQSTLGPYGEWLNSPRYGTVWRPRVAVGWRPYYYGSWQWTDEGWYWDSSEPFAWAVYHYGRWIYDPTWGWVWVPGYQWAPAWVTWRFGVDAVGWAPLAPGISVFVTTYPFVDYWWTFVPTVQFVGVPVYRVAYRPREVPHWFRNTRPAPPRTGAAPPAARGFAAAPAWGGPARGTIESRTGRPIPHFRREPVWTAGERERRSSLREGPASPERGHVPSFRSPPGQGGRGTGPERTPSAAPRAEPPRVPAWRGGEDRTDRRGGEPRESRPAPRRERDESRGSPSRGRGWKDR